MKFKLNPFVDEDDKSKKEAFDKKWNWTKYLLGFYTIGFENKNNKKIESKFLKVFCFLAIIFFIISMIGSVYLISSGVYTKLNTPKNLTISGVGLVIPSISQDDFKDIREDVNKTKSGIIPSKNRRDLVFIPFFLLIPIICIIGTIHEFGHYIACRRFGVKVDEYGLGALAICSIPIIPLGYVKPNEKELEKASKYSYLSIISSGIFMNVIGVIIFMIFYIFFRNTFFDYLFTFNLAVLLLNVLPLGPLDGGLFVKKLNVKLWYVASIISLILIVLAVM
ncbi:MAG: site-2 protease family protein [Candidatus Woesearchaeota archaeon]|jgi:Zn-dependent protease